MQILEAVVDDANNASNQVANGKEVKIGTGSRSEAVQAASKHPNWVAKY